MSAGRVLLTTDAVGGIWDFSLMLARELTIRGWRVTVLSLGGPTLAQRRAAEDTGATLRVEPVKLEWMQNAADDIERTRASTIALVEELRPDVVHANHFAPATVATTTGVPTVLTLHSDVLSWRRWTLGPDQPVTDGHEYAALVSDALAQATAVAAVSGFLAREVAELYDTPRHIDVIHNGWQVGEMPPPATRRRSTFMAGRIWDPAKNVAFAAAAAGRAPVGPVFLAGEQRIRRQALVWLSPAPLHALGFLSATEIAAYLAASRVYLSAARYDPFGLLPLQAALSGCALLLSDIPAYREVWGDAACYFPLDETETLGTRWLEVLDAWTDHAATAGALARRCYNAARMADAYEALYRRVGSRNLVTA